MRVYDSQNRVPGASTDANIPRDSSYPGWMSGVSSSVIAHQDAALERLDPNKGTIIDDIKAVASYIQSITQR